MEPQLPSPSHPETGPVQSHEQLAPQRAPEYAPLPNTGGERLAPAERQPAGPGDPAATVPVAPPPLPQLNQPVTQPQQQAPVQDTNPLVAADEDLIEKEWVEKAKKVIAETKHDPHLQEEAVSRLQADYLQKRYGKTVKLPNDG